MKRFRHQLLAAWLTENHPPCRAADVGGGKGLVATFLNQEGWEVAVIDPAPVGKLPRYRDPQTGKQIRVSVEDLQQLPRISERFESGMAKDFDLLIGLHAHGANRLIIDAAKEHEKHFLILPCCVIDEPIEIKPNINWLDSLESYAQEIGHQTSRMDLNFKGQNIGVFNWSAS